MASTDEVQSKLRELIGRLDAEEAKDALRASMSEPRILALHVTDLDVRFWSVLEDGGMGELREGEPEEAHIKITASSDDLVALVDGQLKLVPAFVGGRLKIDASFSDMLQLRKML